MLYHFLMTHIHHHCATVTYREISRYKHKEFQCDLSDLFAMMRAFNFPILPLTEQLSGQ
jgi:hypothetical protein